MTYIITSKQRMNSTNIKFGTKEMAINAVTDYIIQDIERGEETIREHIEKRKRDGSYFVDVNLIVHIRDSSYNTNELNYHIHDVLNGTEVLYNPCIDIRHYYEDNNRLIQEYNWPFLYWMERKEEEEDMLTDEEEVRIEEHYRRVWGCD